LEDFEKRTASQRLTYMTKEAGIMDFFHNIGTQRGRALAAWEKRYPEVVGKIRQGTIDQLESSQELLSEVLNLLKDMATYRAARKIDDYLSAGKQIVAAFKRFDMGGKSGGFRGFYNTTIKPWMDTQRKLEAEQATASTSKAVENMIVDQGKKNLDKPEATEKETTLPGLGNRPVPGDVMIPSGGVTTTDVEPMPAPPTPPHPTPVPTPPQPERMKSDEVAEELFGQKKSSYDAFVDSLEVFGNENPSLLASHISKYAKYIQAEQPETAVKLFKIAKSLRG
jgi:hypothetical protein